MAPSGPFHAPDTDENDQIHWRAYVRQSREKPYVPEPMGPKQAHHPTVGIRCPACSMPFAAGDWTTLVAIGPGDDSDAREKCIAGRYYNAVAVEAHYSCVTGKDLDPK